jgi:hypothetical protein
MMGPYMDAGIGHVLRFDPKTAEEGDLTEEQVNLVKGGILNLLHISAPELKPAINDVDDSTADEDYGNWDTYYTFTTIRNPFTRFVSWYFFLQPDKNFKTIMHKGEWDESTSFHHHFNDFLDYGIHNDIAPPTYEWFCCDRETKEKLVTDVFKLEEINEVFPSRFKEKTGIDVLTPLRKVAPALGIRYNGNPYDLYNQNSIDLINEVYKSDIETFNYEFGQ